MKPVLYSFRRCPYAMRARLAIAACGQAVELREVVLRDKPAEMLEVSPKATVPVLVLDDGRVIDESIDVIDWALTNNDAQGWRDYSEEVVSQMNQLIAQSDGPFKSALDRYKYPNRYYGTDKNEEREKGADFIRSLDEMLQDQAYLFGERFSVADGAILPFVRQFAHVDKEWFWSLDWKNVIAWLEAFLESDRFKSIMTKYPQWQSGEEGVSFGAG